MGIEVAVAAISGIASFVSSQQQAKAAKRGADQQRQAAEQQAQAQRESIAAQGRMQQIEAQRARIAQVREARIRRASIIASAGNVGLGAGTSGVGGSVGSIQSQAASNIGTISQKQTFADQATTANQHAADAASAFTAAGATAQAKMAQWQAIGSVANSVFDAAGGWETIGKAIKK